MHTRWVKFVLEAFQREVDIICVVHCQSKYPPSTLAIVNIMSGNRKDNKNEIYNWLTTSQAYALEDVAMFDLSFWCVLKANSR
jgi:hypothetical protein